MLHVFFFSSRRRHTILQGDWSSDVCSSDLVTASRDLQTFMYMLDPAGPSKSQWDVLNALESMGFRVNKNRRRLDTIDEGIEYHAEWQRRRHELPYESDGMGGKGNGIAQEPGLGFVPPSPRL